MIEEIRIARQLRAVSFFRIPDILLHLPECR
jgi:hypothetical protein